jgi:cytochrome c oxidase assembly protein subunit 15
MLLAILVVFVLLYSIARGWSEVTETEKVTNKPLLSKILTLLLILSTAQVLIGTQVREAIDKIIANPIFGYDRSTWIEQLGLSFYIHRSFSLVLLGLHIYLIVQLKKNIQSEGILYKFFRALVLLVVVEIVSGAVMAYFSVPAFIQPVHLTLAIVALGLQFVIYCCSILKKSFKRKRRKRTSSNKWLPQTKTSQ